jgi:hypothetical protein
MRRRVCPAHGPRSWAGAGSTSARRRRAKREIQMKAGLRAAVHTCEQRAMQRAGSGTCRGERATCAACQRHWHKRSSADPGVDCFVLVADAQTPSPAPACPSPSRPSPASDRIILETRAASPAPCTAGVLPHIRYPPPRSEPTRTRRASWRNGVRTYQQHTPGTARTCRRPATSLSDTCKGTSPGMSCLPRIGFVRLRASSASPTRSHSRCTRHLGSSSPFDEITRAEST